MAGDNAGPITLTFGIERETKGAIRYAEVVKNDLDEPKIGTLYVRKSTFRAMGLDSAPKRIAVTLAVM